MIAQLDELPAEPTQTVAALRQVYFNPNLIEMLGNSRALRLMLFFFIAFRRALNENRF